MVRCLPELGDLTLVSSGQDSRLYGRWRLIHFAERYWRNISLMQTDSQTSEKLMGGNSGELMSSPEDSLAKMFPQPTLMAKDWMDSEADYGLRCAESLASYDVANLLNRGIERVIGDLAALCFPIRITAQARSDFHLGLPRRL